jgi:ribosomal protein L31
MTKKLTKKQAIALNISSATKSTYTGNNTYVSAPKPTNFERWNNK